MRARDRRAQSRRLVEQRLARGIGRERLALLDADRRELEALVRRNHFVRLGSIIAGQVGEVLAGVGENRVDLLARAVDEDVVAGGLAA